MEKNYKLIGLQIEGLRLIKAAYLKFKPSGLTQIVGKNAMGNRKQYSDNIDRRSKHSG